MRAIALASLLALMFGTAQAASLSFTLRDWSLGCDNTGLCEAVGHQAESDESEHGVIALSLQRAAGPNTPVSAVLFIDSGDHTPAQVQMTIGRQRLGSVAVDKPLPAAQVAALLRSILEADVAIAQESGRTWRLSLAGVKAALLKMDEAQGRLDTPGALVRKGTRPESAVPPVAPVPVLVAQPVPPVRASDEKLLPAILKALPAGDCVPDGQVTIDRLSSTKLLVMRQCWRGAYQSGWDLWVANDKPPFQPAVLRLPPGAGKQSVTELTDPSFSRGVLSSYAKGRGLSDCGDSSEWLYTASGFQLMAQQRAMMCRGIPGGVPVRLWTAHVSQAKK